MKQVQERKDYEYVPSLSVDVTAPHCQPSLQHLEAEGSQDGLRGREGSSSSLLSSPSHASSNIFVARIPPWWTEEILFEKFKVFGEIVSTKIVRDRHYGFVMFQKPESAYAAISQTDNTRPYANSSTSLHVSIAMHDEGMEEVPNPRLFIRGLPPWTTEEHLTHLFSPFGGICECEVLVDYQGKCKGCGFVHFSSTEEATKALGSREVLRLPGWPSPLEIKYSETPKTRQQRQNRNRMRQKISYVAPASSPASASASSSPPYSHPSFIFPASIMNSPTPLFSPPPLPTTPPSSYVLVPFFPSPPPLNNTPLTSSIPSVNLQPGSPPVTLSPSIFVVPTSAMSGDLSFFAPSVNPLVVSALLQAFGPIEKIYSTGQEHTFAARMADPSLHSHIASQLNGTILSTGDMLRVGVYS